MEDIKENLEQALQHFTTSEEMPLLMEAKKEYIEKTGKVDEDDPDYEASINCFYDWYLLQFLSKKRTLTLIKEFCLLNSIKQENMKTYQAVNHSIFELISCDESRGQVLRDVLHNRKIALSSSHPKIGMIVGDFFIGRSLSVRGEVILCHGMLVLPKEVRKFLFNYCRKLRKERDRIQEEVFLLNVEKLRNKVKSFAHVGALNIFKQSQLF